jgi:hypothetical protein
VKTKLVVAAAIVTVIAGGVLVARPVAQAQQTAAEAKEAAPQTPLKVTMVISRYQGEKRTSNLPYTFFINASRTGGSTNLRMGSMVPIPQGVTGSAVASYNYQSIGMSIDCRASVKDDGRYELQLTVQDSQVMSASQGGPVMPPTIQSFTATNNLLLRNGQSVQYTTATDKVSGEVVKIDVTLEVLK